MSLRDVERVLQVMSWFYEQSEEDNLLFRTMRDESEDSDSEQEDEEMMETGELQVFISIYINFALFLLPYILYSKLLL